MKIDNIGRALRVVGCFLAIAWIPASITAQMQASAKAESYGVSVSTATVSQKTPAATLPADGGTAQSQADDVTVGTFVSVQDAYATVSGGDDGWYSDAVSSATLGAVSILGGLITADGVVAMTSSTTDGSDAAGSSLANLVVSGVQISNPAANTRIDLAGVGYVILNEQVVTTGGITVNMIHVVLQQQTLAGTLTTGDIIVGSASSSVN